MEPRYPEIIKALKDSAVDCIASWMEKWGLLQGSAKFRVIGR